MLEILQILPVFLGLPRHLSHPDWLRYVLLGDTQMWFISHHKSSGQTEFQCRIALTLSFKGTLLGQSLLKEGHVLIYLPNQKDIFRKLLEPWI